MHELAQLRKTDASYQSHLDMMNRFQDLVQASPEGLVSQADLHANLGISGRTLRSYCQQHLGMGPARYLRFYRLKLVRRALIAADPANATVKEISTSTASMKPGDLPSTIGRYSASPRRSLYNERPTALPS